MQARPEISKPELVSSEMANIQKIINAVPHKKDLIFELRHLLNAAKADQLENLLGVVIKLVPFLLKSMSHFRLIRNGLDEKPYNLLTKQLQTLAINCFLSREEIQKNPHWSDPDNQTLTAILKHLKSGKGSFVAFRYQSYKDIKRKYADKYLNMLDWSISVYSTEDELLFSLLKMQSAIMLSAHKLMHQQTGQENDDALSERNYNHPLYFQNPGFNNNNTVLHELVRKLGRHGFNYFKNKLSTIPEWALRTMSLMRNDQGKLPIDLLKNKNNEISTYLYDLMKAGSVGSLSDPVTVFVPDEMDATLAINFIFAQIASNIVREQIKRSSTHPQRNNLALAEQQQVFNDIVALRAEVGVNVGNKSTLLLRMKRATFENQIGNCYEFAFVTAQILKELGYNGRINIFEYTDKTGDHVFLLLGGKPDHNPNHYNTLGKQAVICDSWGGHACKADEAPWRLRDFREIYRADEGKYLNCLLFYHPRYSKIVVDADSLQLLGNSNNATPAYKKQ